MAPFRWQNCYADRRLEELDRLEEPWAMFERGDLEDVLRETKMAFALAVQSIWERQLRAYLMACARELRPEFPPNKIERADWAGLRKLFQDLRGIGMNAFPSFEALDTLQLLGNACRHGDGLPAAELSRRCPDLWRPVPPMPFEGLPHEVNHRTVGAMEVSIERLRGFVEAIVEFWQDAEYIYNESIRSKHPSLEARLVRERAERKWVPQAAGTDTSDHGK